MPATQAIEISELKINAMLNVFFKITQTVPIFLTLDKSCFFKSYKETCTIMFL